jgi:hypothetical protein
VRADTGWNPNNVGTSKPSRRWSYMETFEAVLIGIGSLGIAATLVMLWLTS